MFVLIESIKEKDKAQKALEKTIKAHLPKMGLVNIGFPSGNADEVVYSEGAGTLWAAFGSLENASIARRWNLFGVFDEERNSQNITVEINIPTKENTAQVAGFFARDVVTGHVYLMHSGRIGGGKTGVGRTAFLTWSGAKLKEVSTSDGESRHGIVIGQVNSSSLVGQLWKFVTLVKDFKDAVDRGDLETSSWREKIAEYERFSPESHGQRSGSRSSEIDYISYHGEVVNLLREERQSTLQRDERVFNTQLIDLYVRNGTSMTEVYEIKTSLNRQALYTAIGQLMTHSMEAIPNARRILVLPVGSLPSDIEKCVEAQSFILRRFRLTSGNNPKIVLL